MGGTKPWPEVPVGNKDHSNAAVVIIGAGISGMCMAIDLIKRNNCRNFVILEKSGGVGGTWRDNQYPGCCCDVWSMLYSYSFEQNPDWTREYPGQEEILDYLTKVASKHGLYKHIRFNTAVEEARWDDEAKKWKTAVRITNAKESEFQQSYTITSDFLVSAVGQLNTPQYPSIRGLEDFGGKTMHSARWDWSTELWNKKIAIIGNGATAVQIVPEVAKVAAHVAVYQRQANWVIPRGDAPVSAAWRAAYRYLAPLRWRKRAVQMDAREAFFNAVTDADAPEAHMIRSFHQQAMEKSLPGQPEMWAELTPDYAPGCKRVIISDDYFPALARSNVGLETRGIRRIAEKGIEVEGGEVEEFDLIVLATGFRTVEFMSPIKVFGKGGRSIEDIWKGGAVAYNGTTVEDLPNFGIFYGPNTNLGHNSIVLMIEAQSRYLNALVSVILTARRSGKPLALSPKSSVVAAFNAEIQAVLQKSSFADPKCQSWYRNAEGKITNNWSGTVVDYQRRMARVDWGDYLAEGEGRGLLEGRRVTDVGRVVEETKLSDTALWTLTGVVGVLAVAGGWLALVYANERCWVL
ncbi:cyclohexanone monooxygenase [Saccharata proteae CBS 121410]|uniref:Cyclohexanone monooxygenase n=1 Tax=Saccharata proteae CBS 121410 TaxID=1314787 RepID=A0A9P4LZ01_9PEZI|nr:cyclohexanone monooxygenase [Saccharata proteae CBS 121410]